MNAYEIALQLTIAAMENGLICPVPGAGSSYAEKNEANRKQVSEFYKAMLDTVDSDSAEFTVQT